MVDYNIIYDEIIEKYLYPGENCLFQISVYIKYFHFKIILSNENNSKTIHIHDPNINEIII